MTQFGKILAVFAVLPGFSATVEAQAPPQSLIKTPEVNLDVQTGNVSQSKPAGSTEQTEKNPAKPTVSSVKADTKIVEKFTLERVPVYPNDPESAWWEANPRTAFAQAQRQQRPMLLLFTAAWNAKAEALSKEVFTTKTFNEYVKDRLIVCYLNYPRSKSDIPDAMRKWKEDFKVLGYPNLLVFDPAGNVVQELTGYSTGKPVSYFSDLKNIVQPVINATELRKEELRNKGFRDWRNTEGSLLFARFVKWGGGLVTLQSADQRVWTLELSKLGEKDQKFISSFPTAGEMAAGNAKAR